MKRSLVRKITWYYLAVALLVFGIVPKVDAGFSPTDVKAVIEQNRAADIEKVQKVLEIKMVSERLSQLGFTSDEIKARLNGMSDEQIHQLAQTLDDLKVGGDLGWGIVFILVIVILIVAAYLMATGKKVMVK